MSSHTEAKSFLADVNSKMRPLAESANGVFVEQGCASYLDPNREELYVGLSRATTYLSVITPQEQGI